MFQVEKFVRNHIASSIGKAADEISSDHFDSLTQEPQLSSRIAQKIEDNVRGLRIQNYKIDVITQDFPDRGPGSLEKATGIDLYIGIRVSSSLGKISKGVFIQSKWQKGMTSSERQNLTEQCEKMIVRSNKGSFVWVYGPQKVDVFPADEFIAYPKVEVSDLNGKRVTDFFSDVLDCFSGDRKLAWDEAFTSRARLAGFLKEYRVARGVAISASAIT